VRLFLKVTLIAIGVIVTLPVIVGGLGILTGVAVIFLVVFSPFILVGLFGAGCWALVKLFRGGGLPRNERAYQGEDARLLQEIHRSLAGMERRIESLETILLDKATPYERV
jgi:hypothetical protein